MLRTVAAVAPRVTGAAGFRRYLGSGFRWEAVVLSWFNALMPKEPRFFELFARHESTPAGGRRARAPRAGDAVERHDPVGDGPRARRR